MSEASQGGFTIWFTGLSGAGKTTVAHRVAAAIEKRLGRSVEILDGDVVRTHLPKVTPGSRFTSRLRNTPSGCYSRKSFKLVVGFQPDITGKCCESSRVGARD